MRSLDVRSSRDMVTVHRMIMRFKEQAVDPSDWLWFDRHFFRHLKLAYTRLKDCYQTPEFRRFVRSNGPYVWREWNRAFPDVSWKRKVKRFYFCEMPQKFVHLFGVPPQ